MRNIERAGKRTVIYAAILLAVAIAYWLIGKF